jgi:DNA repair protein RadC
VANYTIQKYKVMFVRETDRGDLPLRQVSSKKDVEGLARQYLANSPYESFVVFALDSGNRIIGMSVVQGDSNQCQVYPKMVFAFLISSGAPSFIVAHNHPGGTITASEADWRITKKLQDGAKALDLNFLDHLIVADDNCISLREEGRWE